MNASKAYTGSGSIKRDYGIEVDRKPFRFTGRSMYGGKVYERGHIYLLSERESINLKHSCVRVERKEVSQGNKEG